MKRPFFLCLFVILLSTAASGQTGGYLDRSYIQFDRYYNAERGFDTVEYLSRFWRIAGGSGYNNALNYIIKILQDEGYSQNPYAGFSFTTEEDSIKQYVWEPEDYMLKVTAPDDTVLHTYSAIPLGLMKNSFPTPAEGLSAEVVPVDDIKEIATLDVKGKFVLVKDVSPWQVYRIAVKENGAVGLLLYHIPNYNRPGKYPDMIKDASLPVPGTGSLSGINSLSELPSGGELSGIFPCYGFSISLNDYNYLSGLCENGTVRIHADIKTNFIEGMRKTLIARIKGSEYPDERIVIVSHIDHYKPGANDNASGASVLAEIAAAVKTGINFSMIPQPKRTIELIWVDEIAGSRDYIKRHGSNGIIANITLDMVGEDGTRTGGIFRIERMPDPAAKWLRPPEQHTEWGSGRYNGKMPGNYLNDLMYSVCLNIASKTGWPFTTNPFEGGSDHIVYLAKGIPSLLLWHFTDEFYHTSLDDLSKVSPKEMKNTGLATAITAYMIAMGTENDAEFILQTVADKAKNRLENEYYNSIRNLKFDGDLEKESEIITAWYTWYKEAIDSVELFLVEPASMELENKFDNALNVLRSQYEEILKRLRQSTERRY